MDALAQPALFDEPEPAAETVALVQVCHVCDQPLASVDVEMGGRWYEAALWGYVALQDHLRKSHPEHYRGPLT